MTKFWVAMLVCADLARSRDFYRDVLGLRLKTDKSPNWIEFDLGNGSTLVLHPKTELVAVRPGSLQLGFTVDNVDRFVADCASFNVPVFQDPYDESFGRVAIIGDPDGYPIQVMSPSRKRRAAV
ncbi:MAG TPA: VOC family protein [Candidatus Baltobacteraceae bacterium]|nr:VOC family protein [Candidatus Baltobacteraceae bacterium]